MSAVLQLPTPLRCRYESQYAGRSLASRERSAAAETAPRREVDRRDRGVAQQIIERLKSWKGRADGVPRPVEATMQATNRGRRADFPDDIRFHAQNLCGNSGPSLAAKAAHFSNAAAGPPQDPFEMDLSVAELPRRFDQLGDEVHSGLLHADHLMTERLLGIETASRTQHAA